VSELAPLGDLLGYRFHDPALLDKAMSHRSWCAETPGAESNERLEFLGDAVLGWIVADLAYRRFVDLSEGALTGVRKGVVNSLALAEVAQVLGLGGYLRLGKGEDAAGGREKPSILSDALEAVFGAVYVDGGTSAAYEVIERFVGPRLDDIAERLDELDHKTRLQELLARRGTAPPVYVVRGVGPDHAKRFFASVLVDGAVLGEGEGRSKKAAEQAAAAHAADTVVAARS
jgi:ribonuclease-3